MLNDAMIIDKALLKKSRELVQESREYFLIKIYFSST